MAVDFDVNFAPLSQIAERYRQGQQRQAIEQRYPGSGGDISLARLAESVRQNQQNYALQREELDLKKKLGTEKPQVVWQDGPDGGKVPYLVQPMGKGVQRLPVQGDPAAEDRATVEIPPGVDPKTYRQERAKKAAEIEQSATERLGAVRSADDIITRAENAYKTLGQMNAIGPVSASTPSRFIGGMLSGSRADVFGGGAAEKVRQDYEASAKELELMQAQIKMKGQGQITESERRILALTLPRLDAADVNTGIETLKGVRKQIQDMRSEAEAAKPKMKMPGQSKPPVQGARQAADGNFYVPDPNRPGKYLKVNP
jgi:hypothetical protein